MPFGPIIPKPFYFGYASYCVQLIQATICGGVRNTFLPKLSLQKSVIGKTAANKITFITGTDTGVGKTLFTALMLHHLRQAGVHALAMKPFCSGGRGDVRLLQSLQRGELPEREMNPFYFSAPVAPLVAARGRNEIRLADVVRKIMRVESKCEQLVIEGSGGLLVPLGTGFTVADLIARLRCRVIVVGRNRLGTINHTLLTVAALESIGVTRKCLKIVLMDQPDPDPSCRTNVSVLGELLSPTQIISIPWLGRNACTVSSVKRNYSAIAAAVSLASRQSRTSLTS